MFTHETSNRSGMIQNVMDALAAANAEEQYHRSCCYATGHIDLQTYKYELKRGNG